MRKATARENDVFSEYKEKLVFDDQKMHVIVRDV